MRFEDVHVAGNIMDESELPAPPPPPPEGPSLTNRILKWFADAAGRAVQDWRGWSRRTHIILVIIAVVLLLAGIDSVFFPEDGQSSSAPSSTTTVSYEHMAGTATELKLCNDLRVGEPDSVIDADALAVTNDLAAVREDGQPDDLSLEALGFDNSYNGYGLKSVEWERDKLLSFCS